MTRVRSASLLIPVLVTLAALGGLGWMVRADLRKAWMEWRAQQPLSAEAEDALQRCADPGWSSLVAVLLQDLDVDCDAGFFGAVGASHLRGGRIRWARERAEDPSLGARIRLRAATWLLLAGEAPPRGLVVTALDARLDPVSRQAFLDALAEAGPVPWAPPTVQDELSVRRLEQGEWDQLPVVSELLRRHAVSPVAGEAPLRERAVRAVLDGLGLPPSELAALEDRLRRTLPLKDVPAPFLRVLERGNPCGDALDTPACLRHVAALADAERELMGDGVDGGPEDGLDDQGTPAPYTALEPLLEALYGHEPGGVAAGAQWLGLYAQWLEEAPDGVQRAGWLAGALAHPHPRYRGEQRGDPLAALRLGGGSPWSTAAIALTLGEQVGVPVDVWPRDDGLVLRIGPYASAMGFCGARLAPGVPRSPSLPMASVLALASLEAAEASEDPALQARLRWMAGRLDPVFEPERSEPATVGARLGAQLRAPVASPSPGRHAIARSRLAALVPPPRCVSPE